MTIEEAIQHCEEVAHEKRIESGECISVNDLENAEACYECGEEHKQLAEWLTELKQRREAEISDKPKTNEVNIDRDEILRLCNEIEEIVTAIANWSENWQTVDDCRTVCDKLKEIGKELTEDETD